MKNVHLKIGVVGVLFSALTPKVYAEFNLEQHLAKFHDDQQRAAYMTNPQNIEKTVTENGKVVDRKEINKFPQLSNNDFVDEKIKEAKRLKHPTSDVPLYEGKSKPSAIDNAAFLVPLDKKTIDSMDGALQEASLAPEKTPWSGDYWAIFSGVIAKRYAEDYFLRYLLPTQNWRSITDYIRERPIWRTGDFSEANMSLYSPAEKYDVLVGDKDNSLTNAMLNRGASYEINGKVATWMGICHGWTPASIKEPRPIKTVQATSMYGTEVTFYPDDLKALSSLLWAEVQTPSVFVGSRCNKKIPWDNTGMVTDEACKDNNPATWHLAIVNSIGVHKKSFVVDATFDAEVWNQPAWGYKYTYFNPVTGKPGSLKDSIMRKEQFTNDKFKNRKNERYKKIVGVVMDFTYIAETTPSKITFDDPSRDRKVTAKYIYDLELDENNEITGGEWYHNLHPDFMWATKDGADTLSKHDLELAAQWDLTSKNTRTLEDWKETAITRAKRGIPLGHIIRPLMKAASSRN